MLLFSNRDGQTVLAAVAAVHGAGGRHGLLSDADVMEALATALMENGPCGSSLPPAP